MNNNRILDIDHVLIHFRNAIAEGKLCELSHDRWQLEIPTRIYSKPPFSKFSPVLLTLSNPETLEVFRFRAKLLSLERREKSESNGEDGSWIYRLAWAEKAA